MSKTFWYIIIGILCAILLISGGYYFIQANQPPPPEFNPFDPFRLSYGVAGMNPHDYIVFYPLYFALYLVLVPSLIYLIRPTTKKKKVLLLILFLVCIFSFLRYERNSNLSLSKLIQEEKLNFEIDYAPFGERLTWHEFLIETF